MGKCGEYQKLFYTFTLTKSQFIQMSTFIGKYEAKADVKGRVFIPSTYRKLLSDGERDRIIMHRDSENNCLILYPEHIWNARVAKLNDTLSEWNPEDQMLLMQFTSDVECLDIDSQGRILIAKKHLQSISIENSEILFVGMINRFAIWNKSKFEQNKFSQSEFAEKMKQKMQK